MATVQLRRGATNPDVVDLYGNTDGFQIRHDGWIRAVAEQNEDGTWEPVDEVMTLRVNTSSTDGLASKVQIIDKMLRRAPEFINRAGYGPDSVWLRVKLDGESHARQSLIYRGKTQPRIGFMGPPVSNQYIMPDYQLGLTRHPFWEATEAAEGFQDYDLSHYGTVSAMGGKVAYRWVAGDVPGRISSFYFGDGVGAQSGNYHECWAGFVSSEYRDPDNFTSNWDMGDSDLDGTDFRHNNTTQETITSAYGGKAMRWTPGGGADNNMLERVTAPMFYMVPSNAYEDQRGSYIVLLRARVTSGGDRTFNMRLNSGYYDSTNTDGSTSSFRVHSRVRVPASGVSAGDWFYYPLGIVSIPPHRQSYEKVSLLRYFSLRIEAEVNSGSTGNLEMDAFTLIPINEGAIHIKGAYVDGFRTVFVTTSEDDEIFAHNTSGGGSWLDYHKAVEFNPYNWSIPTGAGRLVIAAQEETAHDKDDTVEVWFDYYPRWLTLRGSGWPAIPGGLTEG